MNISTILRSLKAKILLSVILVVLVIEGVFLYQYPGPDPVLHDETDG
jgi:hypothetical protein